MLVDPQVLNGDPVAPEIVHSPLETGSPELEKSLDPINDKNLRNQLQIKKKFKYRKNRVLMSPI